MVEDKNTCHRNKPNRMSDFNSVNGYNLLQEFFAIPFFVFLYSIMLNHTFLRANEHAKLLSHLEAALFWFQEALCYLAMESVGVEPPACYGTEQGGKAASGAEGR